VVTKTNLGIVTNHGNGQKIDEAFIKEQIVANNDALKGHENFVKVTLGTDGKAVIEAHDFNGKALYKGSVKITYKMSGNSVISNNDMTEYPLSHLPKTDNGKQLGETLARHNPNFKPAD